MVNTKRSIKEIDGSEIVSTIRIGMSFGEDEDHDVVLHMTSPMEEIRWDTKLEDIYPFKELKNNRLEADDWYIEECRMHSKELLQQMMEFIMDMKQKHEI
jgi:hypothetical protein